MVFKAIEKINKGELGPLTLVLGEEEYLIEQVRNAIFQGVFPDGANDFNFGRFDMEESSIDVVLEEASSLPFFDEFRVLFVEKPYFLTGQQSKSGIEHDIDWLTEYISDPADFTKLVFFAPYEKLDGRKKVSKALNKAATIIDVKTPQVNDIMQQINQYLQKEGYTMSQETLERFVGLTDQSLSKMMKELDKLFIYKGNSGNEITLDEVDALVPRSLDQNIFALNDYILEGNIQGALHLYEDLLLQKEDPIKLLAIMQSQFRLLLQSKILADRGYQQAEIASQLKVHPFRVKLALQKQRRLDFQLLSTAHRELIETDFAIKSGKFEPVLAVELFILKFSEKV